MYKIERIGLPDSASQSLKGRGKYPHCLLEVGESFYLESPGHARTIAYKHGYATGKKFRLRRDGVGYRLYRVK